MKATELLKAKSVAATNIRANFFKVLEGNRPLIAVKNGKPEMFMIPYEDMIEFLEIVEESKDAVLRERVERARKEYKETGGVPFEDE